MTNSFVDDEVFPAVGSQGVDRLVDGEMLSVPSEQRRLLLAERLVAVECCRREK